MFLSRTITSTKGESWDSASDVQEELLDELLAGHDAKTVFENDGLLDDLKKAGGADSEDRDGPSSRPRSEADCRQSLQRSELEDGTDRHLKLELAIARDRMIFNGTAHTQKFLQARRRNREGPGLAVRLVVRLSSTPMFPSRI